MIFFFFSWVKFYNADFMDDPKVFFFALSFLSLFFTNLLSIARKRF